MTKIQIVTDSLGNLTQEEIEKYNIKLVHLNILVDGVSYSDKEVSKQEFINMLKNAKNLPKTSQPSIGNFLEIYDSFEEGTEIISLHVASVLSGTSEAARQAGELSKNKVTVIDTTFAERAEAFQVLEAAKLAQAGATVEEIVARCEQVRKNTKLYLCVMTLDNLVKGGRVSRAKGLLSSLLNIKVIFEFKDGVLTPMQKGRGAKSIEKFIDEIVIPDLKSVQHEECCVGYVSSTPLLEETIAKVKNLNTVKFTGVDYTIPTLTIHVGEGAFAISYYHE